MNALAEVRRSASDRGLHVAGLQLDVDSPTRQLPEYAEFLAKVKAALPGGVQLSITGLLDWFKGRTAVASVVQHVDEFVPQFYDADDLSGNGEGTTAISKPFEAGKWGPVFNRFGKRFRIGISTFGRSLYRSAAQSGPNPTTSLATVPDLKQMDVATNDAFQLEPTRLERGNLFLTYRAVKSIRISYGAVEQGDLIQFVLPTRDGVEASIAEVRRVGGHCAGVVCFRWPEFNEGLEMQPDEVLRAAGALPDSSGQATAVVTVPGHCVSVHCYDLYLFMSGTLSSAATEYRIRTSTSLEYIAPAGPVRLRMTGASELRLQLPPYTGRGRLYLGRAVSSEPARFEVEQMP